MEYTEDEEIETEDKDGGGTDASDNPDVPAVPDAPEEPDIPDDGGGEAEPPKQNFCVTCKYKVAKTSLGRIVPQLPTHPLNLNTLLFRNIQKNIKNAVPSASDLGCVHPEHTKTNFVNGEVSPGACSDYNTYGECLFWESAEEDVSEEEVLPEGGGKPDEGEPEADE